MTSKRVKTPEFPLATKLIIPKNEFKIGIEERILIGQQIYASEVKNIQDFIQNKKDFSIWDDFNSEFLKQSFDNPQNEYKKSYDQTWSLGGSLISLAGYSQRTASEELNDFKQKVNAKLENLNKLAAKTELLKSTIIEPVGIPTKGLTSIDNINLNNIFIVHGHNDGIKIDVARTVEKLGLNPIILHEKANEGKTIIEKFETHSNVGFAIVLMTCDDLGRSKKTDEEKFRARQNVILELGYFIGKLGRNRVFPLYEANVELPSDLYGLLYTLLDTNGNWRFSLVRELKSAGFAVDANNIL